MLTIQRATKSQDFLDARNFVNEHHSYIRWSDRPSRKLYYLCLEDGCLVGVFGLGSAFSRSKPVQEYMETHNLQFNEVGNNIVYCLYGSQTKNIGTQFMKMVRNDVKLWWMERYGDTLKALQTFILPPRTGAMYKADNWKCIGVTKGNVQTVRTIRVNELENYSGKTIEKRIFKSGEVKYLLREFSSTPPKLIFMREI